MVTVGAFSWVQVQSLSSDDILPALSGHTMIYSDVPVKCAFVFGGWDGNHLLPNDLWMWLVDE